MDQDKKKFNIDLDFLDEDTKEKPKTPPKTKEADSGSKPHDPKDPNWTYYQAQKIHQRQLSHLLVE